ncbi:MAG: radical SAM protein [Prevotella sp.]
MYFTNITGGEPFIRTDLKEVVRELYKKSDRIVISTNGFFTDRIIDLCKEFPQIGIRISIEGLEKTNNEIRGLNDGYQRGYTTLKKLREMGMKDVGFGMTVQDKNAPDLVPLYEISNEMGMKSGVVQGLFQSRPYQLHLRSEASAALRHELRHILH